MNNTDSINIIPPHALPDSCLVAADTLTGSLDSTAAVSLTTAGKEWLMMCNDSVFAPYKGLTVKERASIFSSEIQPQQEPHSKPRTVQESSDWVFGCTILLLALTSLYLNIHKFKFKEIILSLFDIRTMDRVTRENNIRLINLFPSTIIYLAALSLLALKSIEGYIHLNTGLKPLYFLLFTSSLTLFLLLKNSLIRLLGNIFSNDDATHLYITNSYFHNLVTSIIITPLLLPVYYGGNASTAFLYITLAIISILFIIRTIRGLQLIFSNSLTSSLYLFYYLCILEIAPILIAGKLLIS